MFSPKKYMFSRRRQKNFTKNNVFTKKIHVINKKKHVYTKRHNFTKKKFSQKTFITTKNPFLSTKKRKSPNGFKWAHKKSTKIGVKTK